MSPRVVLPTYRRRWLLWRSMSRRSRESYRRFMRHRLGIRLAMLQGAAR